MDIAELEAMLGGWGEARFRAKQVYGWLHKGSAPDQMHNLPKPLREKLDGVGLGGAAITGRRVSEKDGTVKYLFALEDGNVIEGVLMRYDYGNTLCISTQVGCAMGCAFCASTLEGCVRSLEPGEMIGQVLAASSDAGVDEGRVRAITNVVLMGSGEPLMNYDNVLKFLKLISAPEGLNISQRNISLSTCGIVPKMIALAHSGVQATLSLSLHAPNDDIRKTLMPIAHKYTIQETLAAAKTYAEVTGRRVIIEYALISGVNDSRANADELAARLKRINCHVNLIPLNSVAERGLRGTARAMAYQFASWLESGGVSASVRREMGSDIEGACGQLRRSVLDRQRGGHA
jgi:23S rRNA (adenine2503-C2)-methyltransferase